MSNFPGVEIEPALAGGFYGVALGLVKLDREVRGEVLRAGVAESANDVLVTHNELNWA
ncbi:hypothetical protein [Stutzerimonas stutzeri]|uniref:hypothetical protein n=1 Tax=Stutzerimonas stutzeri TaxID=316 RepID=UPI00210A2F95|nr:hypothetical protein [Stutzerimonas stutzeri]MCQ4320692.1 hypothetical protein [Stutzerimonas stutzeri]